MEQEKRVFDLRKYLNATIFGRMDHQLGFMTVDLFEHEKPETNPVYVAHGKTLEDAVKASDRFGELFTEKWNNEFFDKNFCSPESQVEPISYEGAIGFARRLTVITCLETNPQEFMKMLTRNGSLNVTSFEIRDDGFVVARVKGEDPDEQTRSKELH